MYIKFVERELLIKQNPELTCASLLLKNGVPMKDIQEWLGHSSYNTTANIYAHLDTSSKNTSASKMSNVVIIEPSISTSV